MAIPSLKNSSEEPWEGSPHQGRGARRPRYRRNRHRRGGPPKGRPRSDSESDSSESSTRDSRVSKEKKLDESLFVGLDCEMIGTGLGGRRSALARVTIIDWTGNVLMDEYVQQQDEVTDYRTFVSGITPELLKDAKLDLESCREQVLSILDGKILVGHGLKNDLRVLGITHPWHMTRDTAKYEPFMKVRFEDGILWPRGLRELCKEKLNKDIQASGGPHCPYEDALAALDLYRHVQYKWEKAMEYKINKTRAIEREQVLQLAAATE